MEKIASKFTVVLFITALSLAAGACALGNRLTMKSAEDSVVTGSFRLILYGCSHYDDVETIAILDKEGDPYVFEPFAPDFSYLVKKGVPAKESLQEAEKFVDCHNAFRRAQLSRLVDEKGETLGFEVRSLYMPFVSGVGDVLRTDYRIKGDRVIVRIRLSGAVADMLGDGGAREKER
jgi:hypothetical protein